MQQEAERFTGQQLLGAQLWQYRFDTDTMDAAGATQGGGTWQPAVVVAYKDATGEHEVGVQHIRECCTLEDTCTSTHSSRTAH